MDGSSAGPHFAGDANTHAIPPTVARHIGDLGNVAVSTDSGSVWWYQELLRDGIETYVLNTARSFVGRSLLIHSEEDDGCTQSTGNSGSSIVWCVWGIGEAYKTTVNEIFARAGRVIPSIPAQTGSACWAPLNSQCNQNTEVTAEMSTSTSSSIRACMFTPTADDAWAVQILPVDGAAQYRVAFVPSSFLENRPVGNLPIPTGADCLNQDCDDYYVGARVFVLRNASLPTDSYYVITIPSSPMIYTFRSILFDYTSGMHSTAFFLSVCFF
jgi:hypothetical protein